MRGSRTLIALVTTVLVAGCHNQPMPVTLEGSVSEIRAMAGDWDGRFTGTTSGREGSISFRVSTSGDSASGDVLMTSYTGQRMRAAHPMEEHHAHAPSMEVLRIVFVHLAGGRVSGELEPYIAPDCECRVTTRFDGVVQGDVIRGTYVTLGAPGGEQGGTWEMRRR